jgi:hypothetical protein
MRLKPGLLRSLAKLSLILAALVLVSCSPERRLAKQFMQNREPAAIMLLAPDFVYKVSYKLPDSAVLADVPDYLTDSLLLANTDVIRFVDDSIYISAFVSGFSSALSQTGYKVFSPEQSGEFLALGQKALIINIAQAELEEYFDSIGEKAQFGDEDLYSYEFFITSVNLNFWFEMSGMNHNDSVMRVLFSQQVISDRVDGGFRYFPFTGDVKYIYSVDSIDARDLYFAATKAGELNATYLNDYLLNWYIQNKLPANHPAQKAYTYDRVSGTLKKLKVWGLTEM